MATGDTPQAADTDVQPETGPETTSNIDSSGGAAFEKKAVLVAALAVIVGAFLPWARFMGMTLLGIDGDGILTLILGLLIFPAAYLRWGKRTALAAIVVGVLIALIALFSLTGITAMGVYVTLLGGLVLVGSGVQAYWKL